jgi:hypothetical protein
MNKFIIIAILALSYVSAQRYRCMDKLDGSPAGKCLVVDNIGIYYVSSCKTGKVCDYNEDVDDPNWSNWGQCKSFKLPGFDGQACTSNEECLSNNCDGTSCAEKSVQKEENGPVFGVCINDLACEKGKFCNSDGICEKFKRADQNCKKSNECQPYHVCNYESASANEGKCVEVGSLGSGSFSFINDLPEDYKAIACKGGFITSGNICAKITEDKTPTYENGELTMTVSTDQGPQTVEFRENVLTGAPYPEWNKKKSDALSNYLREVNDNARDDDDGDWAFGTNRLTGNKKKVKEALIKYIYPELYDDEDDDEIECVRKYMQQITLSSKSINISKYLLLLVALFL